MRTIEINGKRFEVINPRNNVYPVNCDIPTHSRIYAFYERPSQTKINIWRNWVDWSYSVEGITKFDIASANCMQFSITGLYFDGNDYYNIYITRDHNRLYKVNSFKY